MLVLGLTGSVAMGSRRSRRLCRAWRAVFDADRAVHDLYRGEAVPLVDAAFPGTAPMARSTHAPSGRVLPTEPP